MLPLLPLFLHATALLYPTLTAANCECGYKLKQTDTFFTHKLFTDFSGVSDTADFDTLREALPDWGIQAWSTPPAPSDVGVLTRQNELENVWVKKGVLHLRQKGHAKGSDGPVSVAEIQSLRDDFYYGSFRAKFRVKVDKKAEGGSVAGFFFYYDDRNETDIEVLTKDGPKVIHYTQHPAYDKATDTLDSDATYKATLSKPWSQFQEHRFDWMPGVTKFYQDNTVKRDMSKNVPQHEGRVIFNLWANNGTWSGPPSTKDVKAEIEYIMVYFNTSASNAGQDEAFNNACKSSGGPTNKSTVCTVDDKPGSDSDSSRITTASAPMQAKVPGSGAFAVLAGLLVILLVWA